MKYLSKRVSAIIDDVMRVLGPAKEVPKLVPYFRLPQDDRALEVYVWILENPMKKHIVATRLLKTQPFFEALKTKGYDVQVFSAARIATGIQWIEPNMALSCTFFVGDNALYENLRIRLRGPDPIYNVERRVGPR